MIFQIDLKLHIFSYLDAKSLCVACCVNQEWSRLTSDELLWQNLLNNDMQKWSQISHVTNPRMYLEINSEWSCKEMLVDSEIVCFILKYEIFFKFNCFTTSKSFFLT